jgi:hypothetical protein
MCTSQVNFIAHKTSPLDYSINRFQLRRILSVLKAFHRIIYSEFTLCDLDKLQNVLIRNYNVDNKYLNERIFKSCSFYIRDGQFKVIRGWQFLEN